MKIQGKSYHTIWLNAEDHSRVQIIDQRWLPHRFVIEDLTTVKDVAVAISEMHVRGAPLIGVTAAFGMYLAALHFSGNNFSAYMHNSANMLKLCRPTAINLNWAVNQQLSLLTPSQETTTKALLKNAALLREDSIQRCRDIGSYGLPIIQNIYTKTKSIVNILTHCNAGWLACIEYGTATAPIYAAHAAGIPIHVWVDETRPRNQGARLTAFELLEQGVAHTVITDNTGGHLMQHGMVDLVIVGTDRLTKQGDVCNKIGTYLKALAAYDNKIPFYVAAPSSSIDWIIENAFDEIPIEQREEREVKFVQGKIDDSIGEVLITPADSPAVNYAFDITPARLVSAVITEKGVSKASEEALRLLFGS